MSHLDKAGFQVGRRGYLNFFLFDGHMTGGVQVQPSLGYRTSSEKCTYFSVKKFNTKVRCA